MLLLSKLSRPQSILMLKSLKVRTKFGDLLVSMGTEMGGQIQILGQIKGTKWSIQLAFGDHGRFQRNSLFSRKRRGVTSSEPLYACFP
jgi:hypothetical protein